MDFSGIVDFFKFLLDSEEIIQYGGLALIVLIVYAENGLFFAFFLPGDYLLFLAGLFASSGQLNFPYYYGFFFYCSSSYTGQLYGLFLWKTAGKKPGEPERFHFLQKAVYGSVADFFCQIWRQSPGAGPFYAHCPHVFYHYCRYSSYAFPHVYLYNITGALAWGISLPVAGYYLGERFPAIINYVEYIILFFIGITTFALLKLLYRCAEISNNQKPGGECKTKSPVYNRAFKNLSHKKKPCKCRAF
jgi:membrane-associated protein